MFVFFFFFLNRYEYLRREGNFERSAGLQVGVDTIEVRETNKQRQDSYMWHGRKKPLVEVQPDDLYWLMDSQKEHCIMNTSVLGWSVMGCGLCPYLWASSCFLSSSPAEPSCGRRWDSLRQFAAFPLSCVCHSCHIHSLSQVMCACVCPYTSVWLPLYHTHVHPPTGTRSCWKFGQTLIPRLSVSTVMVGWQGCHSHLNDLQALEEKTSLWWWAQSSLLSIILEYLISWRLA